MKTAFADPHRPAMDLTELVTRLRRAGFRTDTRQYLVAHRLLLALAEKGQPPPSGPGRRDVDKLAACLSPVFCQTPEEQARFKKIIAQWRRQGLPRSTKPRRRVIEAPQQTIASGVFKPVRLLVALGLLALAAAAGHYYFAPHPILGKVVRVDPASDQRTPAADARMWFNDTALDVDPGGGFSLVLSRHASPGRLEARLEGHRTVKRDVEAGLTTEVVIELEPVEAPPPPPPDQGRGVQIGQPRIMTWPAETPAPAKRIDWIAALATAAGAGSLIFLVLAAAHTARRRLVLKRLPIDQRPDLISLAASALPDRALSGPPLRRLVGGLRRPRKQEALELSDDRTARATARAAGLFSPVWLPRRRMPEYVVFIDRKCARDQQTQLIDEMLAPLEKSDVAMTRYYFQDDPRVCRRADDPMRQWLLSELSVIHHGCRLFIFADTSLFFDPLSNAPAPWTAMLKQWSGRVLFTPSPPFHWSRQEWALAEEKMVVLPATVNGLAAFIDLPEDWRIASLFPAPYARSFPPVIGRQMLRWLDRNPPPAEITEQLGHQLRGFLGPGPFAVLCACAIYPQVSWPLTQSMAQAVMRPGDHGADTAFSDLFHNLARLPWFRYGHMPDWLRLLLIAQMTPDQEHLIRQRLDGLLDRMARGPAGASGAGGLQVARWITSDDLLNTSPKGDPMADAVFAGFMSGARLDRLAVQAPKAFRKLLGRMGTLPDPATAKPRSSLWQRVRAWCKGWSTWHRNWVRGAVALLAAALVLPLTVARFTTIEPQFLELDHSVTHIAYDPSGRLLASGHADGTVRMWEAESGQQLSVFNTQLGLIHQVAFAPDGAMLAAAGNYGGVQLWALPSGQFRSAFNSHDGRPVRCIAFSAADSIMATAGEDGSVLLRDLDTLDMRNTITDHEGTIIAMAFDPSGSYLALQSDNQRVTFLDFKSRGAQPIWNYREHTGTSIAFSPGLTHMATASRGRIIKLISINNRRISNSWETPDDLIQWMALSPDNETLASVGEIGDAIRLWDVGTGQMVVSIEAPADSRLTQIAFHPLQASLSAASGESILSWPVSIQPWVVVPDVVDMPFEQARFRLELLGMAVGAVEDVVVRDRPGRVVSTIPAPGERVPLGSKIGITRGRMISKQRTPTSSVETQPPPRDDLAEDAEPGNRTNGGTGALAPPVLEIVQDQEQEQEAEPDASANDASRSENSGEFSSPPIWTYEKDAIRLKLVADARLNFDEGQPQPLLLCVYQLTRRSAFLKLTEGRDNIYKLLECAQFDGSVAAARRVVVQPGQKVLAALDRAQDARHVAVVAGYFDLQREKMIRIYDIPQFTDVQGKRRITRAGPLEIDLRLGVQQIEASDKK